MRAFIIALLLCTSVPCVAGAVVVGSMPLFVFIETTPEYPEPNQHVRVRGSAPGGKGAYVYSWFVGGAKVDEGIDHDTIFVSTGSLGSETKIRLFILDRTGTVRGEAVYVIRPTEIDIVWEGITYVPPFYTGVAYPNRDSDIRVEAIPHLVQNDDALAPNTLVYEWEVDGKKLSTDSGYGKSSIRVKPTAFKDTTTVTVTVKTRDGIVSGQQSAAIPVRVPRVVVYEKKALTGLWFDRAVQGTIPFSGEEIAFQAFPFFMSNPENLRYAWRTGSKESPPINTTTDVVFRKTGAGGGVSPVTIATEKEGSLFEHAAHTFQLSFE